MNQYLKKLIFNLLLQFAFFTACLGQSATYTLNYNKATQAANAGKYHDAIAYYTLCIEAQPTADAFFDRSSIYNKLNDSCNSCKDLMNAVQLGDNEAALLYHQKCSRTEILNKIPDSLKLRFSKIKQISFQHNTCDESYFRYISFLDKNKTEYTETTVHKKDSVYSYISKFPEYVGGEKAQNRFLAENIKYPDAAAKNGIQGIVYLSFAVDEDGNLKDIKIIRGIGGGCDEEALRVVKLMPKWIPGTQSGKAVRVLFNMTISFSLGK